MHVRLTQIDGKLPNLALMKLARFHRFRGDDVHFTKRVDRGLFEPHYGRVYGSAIFGFSAERVARLRAEFPGAIVGGTYDRAEPITVEDIVQMPNGEAHDYSIYPDFTASIGFTQRGCRFRCKFCVVPAKEGKPQPAATIAEIWRGEPHPRQLHLLDNDFFGQPREQWEARIDEIRAGDFKVCWNQGINIRMIDDATAGALALVGCWDDGFRYRRLYTAWDNLGDEARFFRGVETLAKHGINPRNLLVYMIVGFDPKETWERVFRRFDRMVAQNIRPFPMPLWDKRDSTLPLGGCNRRLERRTLGEFQRWAVGRYYTVVPFEDYDASAKGPRDTGQLQLLEGP